MTGGGAYYLAIDGPENVAFLLTYAFRPGYDPSSGSCYDGTSSSGSGDFDGDSVSICDSDCNEVNPNVFPGQTEVCGNGIDDDCDGTVDNPAVCGTTGGGQICGNGVVEPPEVCDDGNTLDGDSCSSDCMTVSVPA